MVRLNIAGRKLFCKSHNDPNVDIPVINDDGMWSVKSLLPQVVEWLDRNVTSWQMIGRVSESAPGSMWPRAVVEFYIDFADECDAILFGINFPKVKWKW